MLRLQPGLAVVCLAALVLPAAAATLRVPSEYSTINVGLDAEFQRQACLACVVLGQSPSDAPGPD